MSGVNNNIKPLLKELKRTNAMQKSVREWTKIYHKVRKSYPKIKAHYDLERKKLEILQEILKGMENCFTAGGDVKAALKDKAVLLKKTKDFAGHEFLVDKGNTEFKLTFSRLKGMADSYRKFSHEELLFMHSETENLSDMIEEILGNKAPDLYALTYFLLNQKESTLKELPFDEKVKKVWRVYEQGFRNPMEEVLSEAMDKANEKTPLLLMNQDKSKEERINYIMGEWIWRY